MLNFVPIGRIWGRVLGFGEERGYALLASNASAELYAVFMLLIMLVFCELALAQVTLPIHLRRSVSLFHAINSELFRSHCVAWPRSCVICYDSTFGIGIASGRLQNDTEPVLGFLTRRLWTWLETRGWSLRFRHVRAHTGDPFNDLADRWAKHGCLVDFLESAWNPPPPSVAEPRRRLEPVIHVVPEVSVKGLEVLLLRWIVVTMALGSRSLEWFRRRARRWNADWGVAELRYSLGQCFDSTARVRMALFSMWGNGWLTGKRTRHWASHTSARCRFCGEFEDSIEHYFGVRCDCCLVISSAAAAYLNSQPPSQTARGQ